MNYFINSWFNRNEHNNSMNPVKWIKLIELTWMNWTGFDEIMKITNQVKWIKLNELS